MFDFVTPGGAALLDDWFGDPARQDHHTRMRLEVCAECVEDPLAPTEALIETLATAELGRPMSPPKLLPPGGVSVRGGHVTVAGRACCHTFLTGWNDELYKLRLPVTLECPTCRARWSLGWKVPNGG